MATSSRSGGATGVALTKVFGLFGLNISLAELFVSSMWDFYYIIRILLLSAEICKAGGYELVHSRHHLLCDIWSLESMPIDWSLSLLCPVLKKCDAIICSNYRGISLFTIAYRILLAFCVRDWNHSSTN